MLWYKAWLETRWRFIIGLGVLLVLASVTVLGYEKFMELLRVLPAVDPDSPMGRVIGEGVALNSTFNGYIWSQWFLKQLPQAWTLFAALLGAGGLLAQTQRGEGIFTLSLPVSRFQLVGVRAATCLAQLLVLAVVPSLLIPLLAPAVGQSYSLTGTLVHALCLFTAGSVFFSLSFLLSTIFPDVWRPFLIVFCLSFFEQVLRDFAKVGVFRVMSAEPYFRGDGLPWLGLVAAVAASAAMLYGAARNIARHDF
jgi:ABC-2 type transport system permease protein